jgi:hypothetical protein
MTPRRIQQIVDELRAAAEEAAETHHPLHARRYTGELVIQLEHAITQVAQILEAALAAGNLSVALGATRRLAVARNELWELKVARGDVPLNCHWIHVQRETDELVREIFAVMDRNAVPMEVQREIAREVRLDSRTAGGCVEVDMSAEAYPPPEQRVGTDATERSGGRASSKPWMRD